MNSDTARVHSRESDFHDNWASSTDLEAVDVFAAFEAATALENRFIMKLLGSLQGKRVLDVGAGLGESSVYFALQGADVTCTDLSPGMIQTALCLAELHGARINGIVTAAEELDVAYDSFDVVYIANTIHHVTNKKALFEKVRRALKPGGIFVSIDPLAYNPIINLYRRMATQVRTEDEAPLTFSDLELASQYFADVQHREFWILSLALFLKYYLVDRIHPNKDRYWKRIFRESARDLWWWLPLRALDDRLTRLPLLRRMAWNMVMWGRKSDPA
jgi:2-polyprenyl-3-methyl-5-hydroxy-6-metoxy-1,4-benzoquinol methylase